VVAAEVIQRYVRGFLWRRAEERRLAREARIAKERNIRHVRRRQMQRDYCKAISIPTPQQLCPYNETRSAFLLRSTGWDSEVDTDNLHRYQLEDLLMRLGLATSGTREQLLVRFKRWILHRAVIADIAVQCASVSVGRALNGSGGVYTLDVPTPTRREPPLVQLRQFQGKGFTSLGASFASDSVYAIDSKAQLFLLRGRDNYTDTMEPASPPDGNGQAASVVGPAVGGGWLLAGRWFSMLKREATTEVAPGGHHALCCTEGGDAYSWGLNPHGELGSNHALDMKNPQEPTCMTLLPAGESVVSVSAGAYHGAAVSAKGRVYAWGCNTANELAQINTFTEELKSTFYSTPVCVELNAPEYKLLPLSATAYRGASEGRSLESLGGDPTLIPESLYHRWFISRVSCGAAHTACIDNEGRILTWGCRDGGRLGRRSTAWPPLQTDDDDEQEMSASQKRRKQRPQRGAPPAEVDDLWANGKVCIDLCCGAWHTLLLVTDRQIATDDGRVKRKTATSSKTSHAPAQKPTEVFSFGSGITGQLGLGDKTLSVTPAKVHGLPAGNDPDAAAVVGVRAGTYVSAISDSNGQVWMWGARGAGMFQPLPRKAELPKGRRAGGLVDFCCTRDCVVFATKGVGPEYFEEMVELKIAAYRKEREADEVREIVPCTKDLLVFQKLTHYHHTTFIK
jgi:alpha-tubulin suppressor-like RCC1 family protein